MLALLRDRRDGRATLALLQGYRAVKGNATSPTHKIRLKLRALSPRSIVNVREALQLASMRSARVVAGESGLDRDVRWAQVIDMPEPAPWVRPGQLLLTTGFAWPPSEAAERKQIRTLTDRGLAAMALAVPRYLEHFTDAARDEADRRGLPLVEIPFDVPFAEMLGAVPG